MDKTDKFEWSVGDKQVYPIDYTQKELRQVYPIDYTQEEPHEADTKKRRLVLKKSKIIYVNSCGIKYFGEKLVM